MFRSSRDRPSRELSASDISQSYATQIEEFFRRVEGRNLNIFRRRENSLESVFQWGDRMMDDKIERDRELDMRRTTCKDLEAQRNTLRQTLASADRKIYALESENARLRIDHTNEVERLRREHSDQVTALTISHSAELRAWEMKHNDYIQKRDQYIASLNRDHRETLDKLHADHDTTTKRLVSQLLVNQDESANWPDEKLSRQFRELQRQINVITAPHNRELALPKGTRLGRTLDPFGFVSRAGRDRAHFLFKSTIWSILQDHFFSLPFGFGVFGGSKQQQYLLNLYSTWSSMTYGYHPNVSPGTIDFAVFRTNRLASSWRSITFQCLHATATKAQSTGEAFRLDAENVDEAIRRVMSFLIEISKLSGGSLNVDIENQILQAVILARDIGFQFGIHPAQLRLVTPSHGETVEIGAKFHDCEGGEEDRGRVYEVDLVTLPGLEKVGDGRSNTDSIFTIVPCEIYPDGVDS